jgi:hypothetical protein
MSACLFSILALLLLCSIVSSSYPPYYEVTISSNSLGSDYLSDKVGLYAKSELTNTVHNRKVPIYKKMSTLNYLLQEPATGDWIIALDTAGKTVLLRQTKAYWVFSPDTTPPSSIWRSGNGKAIHGLQVTAREECTGSFCEAQENTNNDFQVENPNIKSLLPKNVTETGEDYNLGKEDTPNLRTLLPKHVFTETEKDHNTFLYIGCVVGGGLLFFLDFDDRDFWMRRKRHLAELAELKKEAVETNPDYGNYNLDEYSGVVDQNDYYDIETEY